MTVRSAACMSVDEDYLAPGSALRVLCRKASMTQEQAGAAAGLAEAHLRGRAGRERGLSYKTILALTRAYGATLRDLAREIERP
jgi:transcriptional regulator with XRE-family HTH domain